MWIILQHNILLQEEANVLSKVSNSMVESCVIRRQVIYWKNVSLSYLTSFIKPNIIGNYQFTLILFHTTFYITVFKSQLIVTVHSRYKTNYNLSYFGNNVISCVCLRNKYFRYLEMRYAKHVHEILASRKVPPSNALFLTYFNMNLILCFWCSHSHFWIFFMIRQYFLQLTILEHH